VKHIFLVIEKMKIPEITAKLSPVRPAWFRRGKNRRKIMTTTPKSSRIILNEMERLGSLSGDELKNYISELRAALRREYKALYCRVHRLYSEGQKLSSELSSEVSSEMSSSDKEERTEKENLPPTPPIREKAKKEETLPVGSAARAHEAMFRHLRKHWPQAPLSACPYRTFAGGTMK
jgi:hypothetical protein